jgi:hypothetical protein
MSSTAEAREPAHRVELEVDYRRLARRVLLACAAAELVLFAADYHLSFGALVDVGALRRMSNLAREDGLASWFQATQTLMAGLTLWLVYVLVRARGASRWIVRGWLVLAAFFTYMAVDDGAQIHERMASTFDALAGEDAVGFFPSYTWHLLFLPIFGALGMFLVLFLWRELKRTKARALLGVAMSCLVLAVGLDFIEGLEVSHSLNVWAHWARSSDGLRVWSFMTFGESAYDTLQHFSRAVEESLEMVAMSIFWSLFIAHLAVVGTDIRIRQR